MNATQDTEITLGTGKMLALFFGLVALCAVFFGMGYSLGRTSSKPAAAAEAQTPASVLRPVSSKSSAPSDTGKQSDLTFYKAVEQKDANPQLTPAEAASSGEAKEEAAKQPAPPDPTMISGSSYYVQVAAVSKQEDAESLVDALKKKQYPAFTANGAQSDKLFHVQVGPFGDIKDAEATRTKLISDGYNPILKK